jgi:hypothetical protein
MLAASRRRWYFYQPLIALEFVAHRLKFSDTTDGRIYVVFALGESAARRSFDSFGVSKPPSHAASAMTSMLARRVRSSAATVAGLLSAAILRLNLIIIRPRAIPASRCAARDDLALIRIFGGDCLAGIELAAKSNLIKRSRSLRSSSSASLIRRWALDSS